MKMKLELIFLILSVLLASSLAQTVDLKIGTKLTPPFVLQDANGDWIGYSIELFEFVVKLVDTPINFTWVGCDGLTGLLSSIKENEINMTVAGLTATSARSSYMDFSEEIFTTGKQIMTNDLAKKTRPTWLIFAPFSSSLWLFSGGMIVFVGLMVWILEHPYQDDMVGLPFIKGIKVAVWNAFQNFFGAGDFAFHSAAGRFFAVAWIIIATTVVSLYTANLASILTVTKMSGGINSPDDLPGRKLGAVLNSLSYDWAKSSGAILYTYETIEDSIAGVVRGEVDAIVADSPTLIYYKTQYPDEDIDVVGAAFDERTIAMSFALNFEVELEREINQAILLAREQGYMDTLYQKYFTQAGTSVNGEGEDDETDSISLADVYKPFLLLLGAGVFAAAVIRAIKAFYKKKMGLEKQKDQDERTHAADEIYMPATHFEDLSFAEEGAKVDPNVFPSE